MKIVLAVLLTALSFNCLADAGFSIRRKKATSIIKVTGIENLTEGKLIYLTHFYNDTSDKRPFANKGRIIENGFETSIQAGGRRWEESDRNVKFILVNMVTGAVTDSIQLYAKKYNLNVKILGEKQGRIEYKIDSSKAVYQYAIGGDDDDSLSYSRNRLIFIACSVTGFLLLAGLFIYNKRKNANKLSWD